MLDSGADQHGAPLNTSWIFPPMEVVLHVPLLDTAMAKVSAQSTILTVFSDPCSSVPLSSDPSCIIFGITIFPSGIFHFSNSIMAFEVRAYFLPHEKQYLLNVNCH